MDKECLNKSFELKGASITGNTIAGAASVMGNIDRGDDCIFPGAFKTSIQQLLTSGFVAANHDWTWEGMKAMPKVAEERGNKLYTEAIFHSTPDAQDIRTKCMERIENNLSVGLSIGFGIDPESCKYFKDGPAMLDHARTKGYDLNLFNTQEIMSHKRPVRAIVDIPELYEYSMAAVPMNPLATADSVKSAGGSTTLPIADRDHAWDSGEAEKRVREWAGAGDAPNAKYAKAFFWHAEDPSKFGDFKLPFADVIDGKLTAIPKGVFAGAAAIQGARGGVDIPEGDVEGVKAKMARYYERFRAQFEDESIKAPWEEKSMSDPQAGTAAAQVKGQYLGEYVEAQATLGVLDTLCCAMWYAVCDVVYDCDMDEDSPEEMMTTIRGIFDEFTETGLKILGAILASDGMTGKSLAEGIQALWPSPEEVKNALPAGARLAKHSAALLAGATELKERMGAMRELRLKDGRMLSQANQERLAAHRDSLQSVVDDLNNLLTAAGGTETDSEQMSLAPLKALRAKALAHRADLALIAMGR